MSRDLVFIQDATGSMVRLVSLRLLTLSPRGNILARLLTSLADRCRLTPPPPSNIISDDGVRRAGIVHVRACLATCSSVYILMFSQLLTNVLDLSKRPPPPSATLVCTPFLHCCGRPPLQRCDPRAASLLQATNASNLPLLPLSTCAATKNIEEVSPCLLSAPKSR